MTVSPTCPGANVYTEVPDGGWGWAVALAFFFVEVFTYGVIKSFGVFFKDLMVYFDESNSRISWIISICVFVLTFTAPLSTVLSNRFGHRPVVMLGGFLISLGMVTASFARNVVDMYLTIGVVSGLGYCLSFLPTVTILSQYFQKRRSLVTAVASTGECFAVFAFAPAITALKHQMGWRYCLLTVGALQLNIVVCGALLRPIFIKFPEEAKEPSKAENLESSYMLENEQTLTSLDSIDSGVEVSTSPKNVAGGGTPEKKSDVAAEKKQLVEPLDGKDKRSAGRLEPRLRVGFLLLCCWNGCWGVLPCAGEAFQDRTVQKEGNSWLSRHEGDASGFSGDGHGQRRWTCQKLPESQCYTISCNLTNVLSPRTRSKPLSIKGKK